MTNSVTLDSYSEEIRVLIHSGRSDEAIAICMHILHYYPKHVETYRQLGEACLDKGDLDNAKEMFRRVLSSDPESVIAYIGLATVFEQQQLIEEAVWYLERAYEIALNNPDIHKELFHLYAEANKPRQRLKMTPAGLARLYAQEGLYPQAIQELRAIVEQSALRFDARIALAEILWRAGRVREAADVAQALLTPVPYCLKANLILGTAWKESGLPEYKTHLDLAQELDPTNKVAQKLFGSRSPLPAAKVNVPRYGMGASSAPDSAGAAESPSAQFGSELRGPATEPVGSADSGVGDLAVPVRLPDSSAPAGRDTAAAIEEGAANPQLPPTNLPPWLMPQFPGPVTSEPAPSDDWQHEENAPAQAARDDAEIFASGLDGKGETAAMSDTERLDSDTANDDDLPDWLRDLQAKASPAAEPSTSDDRAVAETGLPARLESPGDAPAPGQGPAQEQSSDEELPGWLRSLHAETAQDSPSATVNAEPAPAAEDVAPAAATQAAQAEEPAPVESAVEEAPPPSTQGVGTIAMEMPPALPPPGRVPELASGEPAAQKADEPSVKRKREPKAYSRLVLARTHRDAGRLLEALAEYDYVAQHSPRLVKEVISDLEAVTAQLDAPLEAHRILGDAYSRDDRLADALNRYQFVLERTPSETNQAS